MSEKHIEIKIGLSSDGVSDFTSIVDVETNGRLFYEEVFPKHAEHFVKCWNSHDAMLDACKDIQAAPKRLDKREKMGDTVHITITRQQMKNINTAIAQAEKEG